MMGSSIHGSEEGENIGTRLHLRYTEQHDSDLKVIEDVMMNQKYPKLEKLLQD